MKQSLAILISFTLRYIKLLGERVNLAKQNELV
jgi:hypothetical protein